MTLAKNYIFPLVWTSMFYPLNSSPNSLRLKVPCPSTRILTGTDVRIGMEMHPTACSALENFGVLRHNSLVKCSEPSVLSANIQVISRSKTVSITWVQQHTDSKCYSDEIFLLDVEQRMKDVNKPNTFYISNWCFQFQIKSGRPKIKESISYEFDCIETIPETEAYLINTTLWSLPVTSLSSSDERDCGRSKCYRLTDQLNIRPALRDNYTFVEECLCWNKSNISIEILAATEDGASFRTSVTDTNPYAKMLYFKVYRITDAEEYISFEKDIQLSEQKMKQEIPIEFTLSCGTYTAEIMYYCDDSHGRSRYNSRCAGRHTDEFILACKSEIPRKHLPDITVIAIIASFLLGSIIVLTILVFIRVCRGNCRSNLQANSSESDVFPCNNQLDLIRMEMLNPVPYGNEAEEGINFEEEQPLAGTGKKVMFLCHQDFMDRHQKETMNLLVSLLLSLGITIYGYDESALFSNWLTLADKACKDDITNFIIVASLIDTVTNEGDGLLESSQHLLFSNAVMTNLRTCQAERNKFYVHILCFHESEAPIISNFIDKYKSCLKIRQLHKNTFIYCLSKHLEETSSYILHMDALVFLLARILKCNLNDFENRISYDANISLQNLKTSLERDFNIWESKL